MVAGNKRPTHTLWPLILSHTLHCPLYIGYSEYPQCWRVIKSSGFIVACDRKRDMECANQGSSGHRDSVTTDYQRDHSEINTKSWFIWKVVLSKTWRLHNWNISDKATCLSPTNQCEGAKRRFRIYSKCSWSWSCCSWRKRKCLSGSTFGKINRILSSLLCALSALVRIELDKGGFIADELFCAHPLYCGATLLWWATQGVAA